MDKSTLKKAKKAIAVIAAKEGISEDRVRFEIESALRSGYGNTDPHVRAIWNSIPYRGDTLSAEKFIAYAAERAVKKING